METTRSKHEDVDRFQRIIRDQLDYTPKSFRDSVQQSHVVDDYLGKIIQTKNDLVKIYEDADSTRKDELNGIVGSGRQIYSIFYDKIKDLRNYYRQFPSIQPEHPESRVYFDVAVPPFSGEESYGRYLDLHEHFSQYLNLDGVKKIDYYTYLDGFFKFPPICEQSSRSFSSSYLNYLESLLAYLSDFIFRSQPLMNISSIASESEVKFEGEWSQQAAKSNSIEAIDDNPLYCKACQKLFAKETVFNGHLKGKKHIKAAGQNDSIRRATLLLETKVGMICSKYLLETIENSRVHVEKKISRNYDEIEEEDEVEKEMEEQPAEDDDVEIQTTKQNYPVGWDGKPIPYWLYKLHGLGVEYRCEICGNASYWGRKAYECHFQEWRHAHGMKCLGIPNNIIFRDITKINDALMLWEKIKKDGSHKEWKPDVEEEFEDKEGNVFNKKVFLDLKRQGLLG